MVSHLKEHRANTLDPALDSFCKHVKELVKGNALTGRKLEAATARLGKSLLLKGAVSKKKAPAKKKTRRRRRGV